MPFIFAELLGVTDSAAYRYGAELRRMVSSFQLHHISFLRVQHLLSNDRKSSGDTSDLSEAKYLFNAPITGEEFLSTDIGNFDADATSWREPSPVVHATFIESTH